VTCDATNQNRKANSAGPELRGGKGFPPPRTKLTAKSNLTTSSGGVKPLSSEEDEFLEVASVALPRIIEIIATFLAEHRAGAFEVAERRYMQAARDFGCTEELQHAGSRRRKRLRRGLPPSQCRDARAPWRAVRKNHSLHCDRSPAQRGQLTLPGLKTPAARPLDHLACPVVFGSRPLSRLTEHPRSISDDTIARAHGVS
jgi:hypothetical protein